MKKVIIPLTSVMLLTGMFIFSGCNSTKVDDTPMTVESIDSPADADPTISDRVIPQARDSAATPEVQPEE